MKVEKRMVKDIEIYVRPDTTDEQCVQEVIERDEYQRKDFKIEEGEHWIDIGANIGAFSAVALKAGAKVWAFEPEPKNFQLLEKNLSLQPNKDNATVTMAAVTDHEGSVDFYIHDRPDNHWRHSSYKEKWANAVSVKAVDINHVIQQLKGRICIKLDAEGAEFDILPHITQENWERIDRLVMEYHFDIKPAMIHFWKTIHRIKQHLPNINHRKVDKTLKKYTYYPPAMKITATRKGEND